MQTQDQIIQKLSSSDIKKELQKYNIKHIRISWSTARWENTADSDLDIIYEADYRNFGSERNRWPIWAYEYLSWIFSQKIDIMSKTWIRSWAKESLLSDMIYIW